MGTERWKSTLPQRTLDDIVQWRETAKGNLTAVVHTFTRDVLVGVFPVSAKRDSKFKVLKLLDDSRWQGDGKTYDTLVEAKRAAVALAMPLRAAELGEKDGGDNESREDRPGPVRRIVL